MYNNSFSNYSLSWYIHVKDEGKSLHNMKSPSEDFSALKHYFMNLIKFVQKASLRKFFNETTIHNETKKIMFMCPRPDLQRETII